jgi:acetyl-CoA acetyltransferase
MNGRTGAVIAGAAESTEIGVVPTMSALGLAVDASRRALADCGLTGADVDGIAATGLAPYVAVHLAAALGIEPSWVDATMVGGCSSIVHVGHAVDAIASGRCKVVLVAHGESGRSGIGMPAFRHATDSLQGQFEQPFGAAGPMTLLSLGTRRFLADRALDVTALAEVVVAQREWAARNPRALRGTTTTVDEVLAAPPVAAPLTRPMCCVVTDGGGAVVLTSAERAADLPRPPVHVLGAGAATGSAMVWAMPDLTSSAAFRRSGAAAFAEAGLGPADIDHAMLYDAIATLPLIALEDLGFVGRGESAALVASGATRPGGRLPVNTTGGGIAYTHSGMYGIYALLESVRQLRGEAAAQVDRLSTSLVHTIGGMFHAAATLILADRTP